MRSDVTKMASNEENNLYQREWYQQRVLSDPQYREKQNAAKRERRRKKRSQSPQWILKEINRLMKICKRLNAQHELWQRAQENKKYRSTATGQKVLLNCRLKNQRQNTTDLTDGYIKRKLCHRCVLKREDIPKALIEFKRAQIILSRAIKEQNNENDGRTKKSTIRYR